MPTIIFKINLKNKMKRKHCLHPHGGVALQGLKSIPNLHPEPREALDSGRISSPSLLTGQRRQNDADPAVQLLYN